MQPLLKYLTVILLLVTPVTGETIDSQAWFEASMRGEEPAALEAAIAPAEIGAARVEVFDSYRKAALANGWDKRFRQPDQIPKEPGGKIEIKAVKYQIADGLAMPYVAVQRGQKPADGWPLAIAMHGGGGTGDKLAHPHAWPVNSREWNTQVKLALSHYPGDAIYFVPRMVDDNQGRWWKEFNVTAYDAMIRHASLFWDIDPNRVYLLGISEGGYGTETLACRYPDKFAAANGLACGSGTSIHVENLRNLPFRTDVGEKDTMFGRRPNAVKKHALLDRLREADPAGYVHHLEVHLGRGHGIDYRPGPRWMFKHVRNPHPERVTLTLFQHDKVKNNGAYWIHATNDLEKKVIYLDAQIDKENNQINLTAEATVNDEVVQAADAQQALADQGETAAASGLELRLWLHESLLDLSRPIAIRINGEAVKTVSPKPRLSDMCESLMLFGDPNRIYPSKVDVAVP